MRTTMTTLHPEPVPSDTTRLRPDGTVFPPVTPDPPPPPGYRSPIGNLAELEARLARLTSQERRVLDLITEGCTNRQIGDAVYLAEKTVKNHVTTILRKLGVTRRTEAAVFTARLAERRSRQA